MAKEKHISERENEGEWKVGFVPAIMFVIVEP